MPSKQHRQKLVEGSKRTQILKAGTMNYKILLGLIAVSAVSGCVITDQGRFGGDVTFSWTFAGQQCAAVPQVSSVRIIIPGEVLQNNGVFPCLVSNYPGIILQNFAPGDYTYTIQGLAYAGDILYQAGGSFTVDGNVSVQVDLPPVGAGTSYAYLMWTFPPNGVSQTPNCAQAGQAGIAYVDIRIDQGAVQRANCSDGFTQPGFRTSYLPAGLHQIELLGLDVNNFPYYRYAGTLQTNSASPVSASYGFNWNVGGASIAWQLINGGFILSCSQANVDRVFVNFRNASGQLVYPSGDPQWCGGAPILYNALFPGTYQIILSATAMGGTPTYRSDPVNPPTVTIVAGAFVDASSTPVTVAMNAQ